MRLRWNSARQSRRNPSYSNSRSHILLGFDYRGQNIEVEVDEIYAKFYLEAILKGNKLLNNIFFRLDNAYLRNLNLILKLKTQ